MTDTIAQAHADILATLPRRCGECGSTTGTLYLTHWVNSKTGDSGDTFFCGHCGEHPDHQHTADCPDRAAVELVFSLGNRRHYDAPCPLCGEEAVMSITTFGVAVRDGARVCDDCAEKHLPAEEWNAMQDFLAALEELDSAIHQAAPRLRLPLLVNAVKAAEWLAKRYQAEESGS